MKKRITQHTYNLRVSFRGLKSRFAPGARLGHFALLIENDWGIIFVIARFVFFFWHPTPCDWLHRKVLVENIVCFHIHYFFSLSRNNPYSYVRSPICYSHHSFQRHFYIWGLRELVSMMWFWIRLRTYFVPQSWPWVFLSFRTHESIFITLPFSSRWTVEIILMPKSSFKWIICDNNKFIFSFFFSRHRTCVSCLFHALSVEWCHAPFCCVWVNGGAQLSVLGPTSGRSLFSSRASITSPFPSNVCFKFH